MNLLDFQFTKPAAKGSILYVASSPSWHSSIIVRRLLELYPDRRIHVIAKHKEILSLRSPRLTFHAFESDRVSLTPAQSAMITADRVECAFYAQMVESAYAHEHIFKMLTALGINDCFAVDQQLNVMVHSGNLGWVLPRRVGPYTLTLPALISGRELDYLYQMAHDGSGEGHVVEIGTMAGGSAVALALGSRDSGRGSIYTIDIQSRPEVQQTLSAQGVSDLVNIINMPSKDVATNWSSFTGGQTAIRMLWIDGDHTYEGVWTDILHWRDYVEPGGIICFHDYSETFPGVVRAVYEHVIGSPMFEQYNRIDSIFSAVKKPVARSNRVSVSGARSARVPDLEPALAR
jgi:predicted O-methyltransferase YrrM